MNQKSWFALLLAGILSVSLTACSSGSDRSGSTESSGSEPVSQQDSESQSSTAVTDFSLSTPTTADEAAEYFKQALLAGNTGAIREITGYEYTDWADTVFDSIEYQTIAQDFASSRYQFTFTVSQSSSSTFPTGTYQRVAEVTNVTTISDHPMVTMLYQEGSNYYELFPYDMEQTGYEAYSQVHNFVGFMGNITFGSPSELTDEQMTEYAMLTIFNDYAGERELFSVKEVNEMVQTLFGATVDASQTRFYNAEEGGCEMVGRGGISYYTMTAPASYDESTKRYTLDMNFYTDPLCTVREKTIRYTLEKNGNHLKFISAVEV